MPQRRRGRDTNRRTIIDMLETTPATESHGHTPSASEELADDLDFDWRPLPLERVVAGDRSFRWPIIGAALVLAALAIVTVRGLGTFSEAQADERLAAYRSEVSDFAGTLDELEAALPNISLEQALAFEAATDSLRTVAAEDLPGLPPFIPQGALGDVADAQEHLLGMVDVALEISADLAVAATYGDAAASLLAVPPLPFSVPEELITPAGEAITEMQSTTEANLASLEPNDTFATYLSQLESALESVPEWTDRYLLALRRGDAETAETLVGEIQALRQSLDDELAVGLSTIAIGVEERIAELRAAILAAEVLTASS